MKKIKRSGHLKGARGFEMDLDGHTLLIDTPESRGGDNAGPTPKQLVLAALIGCIGVDVTSIADKKKLEIEDIHIELEADLTEGSPSLYENIHLTFKFKGKDLKLDVLNKMVNLSKDKYCPVSIMLGKHTSITCEAQIVE